MSGNGHSKEFRVRSVGIRKEGDVDPEKLDTLLDSMQKVLVNLSEDTKQIRINQEKMELEMRPVISFHRKMRVAAAILAIPVWMISWGKLCGKFINETLFQ